MRTAVLGLGQMGRALAGRLLDTGHEVTVWNRSPGRDSALVDQGASSAATPADAIRSAEVVLASLADDEAVHAVLAPGGQARPGFTDRILVDTSTVSPVTARQLGMLYGDHFVASPIFGAPHAVAAGTATLAVGGPSDVIERLSPLWTSIASSLRVCGDDPGQALIVKLLSNYLLMAGIAVLSEAVATGLAAGLEPGFLGEVLGDSPLVAPALHNRLQDVLQGDHQGWFSTVLAAKDVHLAHDLARSVDVDLPLAALVEARYRQAASAGWADADIGAIIELYRPD